VGTAAERATVKVDLSNADLWRDYREAFGEFARKARNIQALKANRTPARAAVDRALLELVSSHLDYNRCRDALACALLARSHRDVDLSSVPVLPCERIDHVSEIAELLWECEGRREGQADEDWYRAEEIIRRAVLGEAAEDDAEHAPFQQLTTA
jgi:hypothetical protein